MAGSASLSIRVLVDAAQGAGQLRQLGDAAGDTGSQFDKMFKAAAAFAGVGAFIKSAVTAASNLQQSTGGVEAVFKNSSTAVKQFAEDAADSLGLSKNSYQELATVIGSQLKNAGVAMSDLAPKTDEIIRKGGDLAAMFGGTTAEAVGALSSALKGERDPIERYGISLNEAAIQAEIMALGLDTSTNAAKQAATQQATLSLINKQSADSMGAAARESESYASVMQQLNAVWENTIAEVGAALLPALAGLADHLGDLVPMVSNLLTPLAELTGWLLGLPTPILAVAAGIALWKFSPISGMLTRMGTAMSAATGSARGFGSAMASIGKAVGAGALLGGLILAFDVVSTNMKQVEQGAKDVGNVISTLGDKLIEVGDQGSAAFLEFQRTTLESTDAFTNLVAAGASYGDAMTFLTDKSKMTAESQEAIREALSNMDDELAVNAVAMSVSGQKVAGYAEQKQAFLAAEAASTAATQDNSAATKEAAEAQAKAAEETAKAALEAAKSAAAQTAVKTALDGVKQAADTAATAVQFFVLQMDLAAGRTPAMDQAAQLLNDTLRETGEAFKGTAEGGGVSLDALVNWNAAALTSTADGSALYTQLTKVQTAYGTSTIAAYENAGGSQNSAAAMEAAAGAADTAYNAFIQTATGAGLTTEAAAALAANLGIVQGTNIDPKTFELIAKDEQADQAVRDLEAASIADKAVTIDATVAPAEGAMQALEGQPLENTVKLDADPKSAQSTINGVVNEKRTTTPVNVTADPSQANSTVNGFTQTQRSTQVQVTANTTAAQSAITSLVNQSRTLTITVDANTGPAMSRINSVVNGSYTATINVTANTSAATAAIASVPRSVTVSPPPAPVGLAAPGAMRSMGAPAFTPAAYGPMHLSSNTSGPQPVGNVTYEINVQGGWDSSDAIARKVLDVIERRERRVHGVQVRPT